MYRRLENELKKIVSPCAEERKIMIVVKTGK